MRETVHLYCQLESNRGVNVGQYAEVLHRCNTWVPVHHKMEISSSHDGFIWASAPVKTISPCSHVLSTASWIWGQPFALYLDSCILHILFWQVIQGRLKSAFYGFASSPGVQAALFTCRAYPRLLWLTDQGWKAQNGRMFYQAESVSLCIRCSQAPSGINCLWAAATGHVEGVFPRPQKGVF